MTDEQKSAAIGALPISQALKGAPTYSNQEAVTNSVVDMIVDLNLPLTVVRKDSFKKVLAVSSGNRWKPVSFQTIRERIIQNGSNWAFDNAQIQ